MPSNSHWRIIFDHWIYQIKASEEKQQQQQKTRIINQNVHLLCSLLLHCNYLICYSIFYRNVKASIMQIKAVEFSLLLSIC